MPQIDAKLSTGLIGLDRVLKGLIPGDNIVWQVEDVEEYAPFVPPFCAAARKIGSRVIYLRFADHPPLVESGPDVDIHTLDASEGFESFVTAIHRVIDRHGRGGAYVFDCLSGLAERWYSDRMLGNFFMLTCPYLYDVEALAFFCIRRNRHSYHATSAILETTQIFINVYTHEGATYVHPLKVLARHSPTMNLLHIRKGQEFRPVTESAVIGEIHADESWSRLESASREIGIWNNTFEQAEEILRRRKDGHQNERKERESLQTLLRMIVSRDPRVLELAETYFTLDDVVTIGRRLVGSGLIGGKSVGMLLSRAILRKDNPRLGEMLEPHDSFYIGSDVFYSFLVRNGLWWIRNSLRDPKTILEGAGRGRHRILLGKFPDDILRQFEDVLDYFGQSPIIVRSSSLLEDNFGNAFAGKYESVFCANQGPRRQRLDDFLAAVLTIYASSMGDAALTYRHERGLLECDEQMALLVQRVSGRMHEHLFFPPIAGVGFSFNPYVWNRKIEPQAGLLRLVFGLGTRAVDRSDDDYTRVVALNAPDIRPESNFDEVRRFSQRRVDVLDLEANQLVAKRFPEVAKQSSDLPIDLFAGRPDGVVGDEADGVLTFEKLLHETDLVRDMRELLQTLEHAYEYPVDIEYAVNFPEEDRGYKINLLQCRPLQVKRQGPAGETPDVPPEQCILRAHGAVIGQRRTSRVDRVIFIDPTEYGRLPLNDRHTIARRVGQLVHASDDTPHLVQMLIGPGRWGTSSPELGVPVTFSEISRVSVLCEVVAMREDLVPDVSLGTHFFNDLVESNILYFALFPTRQENLLREEVFRKAPNRLTELLPEAGNWEPIIHVKDAADLGNTPPILHADFLQQEVMLYQPTSA
ncbi:MAG: PEP/pyruvate-binding domain-containing protein [Phycisphaerae bacterium]|nr:PEP/pyruvate-binding domain-containing protein [Phycisphaerae bacterium]